QAASTCWPSLERAGSGPSRRSAACSCCSAGWRCCSAPGARSERSEGLGAAITTTARGRHQGQVTEGHAGADAFMLRDYQEGAEADVADLEEARVHVEIEQR